jgi:ribosomal protein L37AE/L43A
MELLIVIVTAGLLFLLDFIVMQFSRPRTCPYCGSENSYKRGLIMWSCRNPTHSRKRARHG